MRDFAAVMALVVLHAARGTPVLPLTPGEQKVLTGMGTGDRRPGIPLDHEEQPYGHMYMVGSPTTQEFFRANFGGLIPCGSRQVAWMPDRQGCSRVDTPVVSSKFAVAMRGTCTFATKAAYAQKAGAHGLVIINNEPGLIRMPLGNRSINEDNAIYIPSVMVRESFARIADRFASVGRNLTAAFRPFRDHCVPDGEYVPHQIIHKKISPSSPEVIKRGGRSPFVLDTPPGDTTWEPERATGGRATVGIGPDLAEIDDMVAVWDAASPDAAPTTKAATIRAEFALAAFGGPVVDAPTRLVASEPMDACANLSNAAEAAGRVVVATRGVCPMIDKARAAQRAGAVGLLLINNDETPVMLAALGFILGQPGAVPQASQVTPEAAEAMRESAPSFERVGVVQAAPDNHPGDVDIGVAMVSGADGNTIIDVLGEGRDDVFVRLDAGAGLPVGELWEEIRELLRLGASYWAKDDRAANRTMVRLVRGCDPRSARGDEARMQSLIAATLASGADRATRLLELAAELGFDEAGAPLDHDSDRPAPVPTPVLSSAEPATAFLLERLPADSARLRKSDSLGCSIEGGSAHVRVAPSKLDQAVGISVAPRIADLLKYQACIEKLLLHNTAAVGHTLSLLRAETKADVFSSNVHGLFRRYGSADAESSIGMAERYMNTARAIDRASAEGGRAGATVGSALRAE